MTTQTQSQSSPPTTTHLLVVIDHREARVYKTELHGSVPHRIIPHDPHGTHRHLHDVEQDHTGKTKREPKEFYDAIIKSLDGAEKVLFMGSSTGSSSAMDHLTQEIKENHPDLAKKILATLTINQAHMSEDQILAQARDYYAAHP